MCSAGNCVLQVLKSDYGNICQYLHKKVLIPKFKGTELSLKTKFLR